MPINEVLVSISIGFIILGFAYAGLIYKSPMPHGWTWLSVVVGDGIVDLASALVIILILEYNRLLIDFWWFIFIPVGCHVLLGGPMIIMQIFKHRQEIKSAEEINNDE